MDTIAQILKALALKPPPLLLANSSARDKNSELIARLTLRGAFTIISGTDRLPASSVVQYVRRLTNKPEILFDHVPLARAGTCFQLADLLEEARPKPEPLLVFDFFCGFYDQDIKLATRMRILQRCIQALKRLSHFGPVIVLARHVLQPDDLLFYPALEDATDQILYLEDQKEAAIQLALL
jgi:hypothetical protein